MSVIIFAGYEFCIDEIHMAAIIMLEFIENYIT